MKNELTKEEINRKLLHGLAVVLPVSIFYGPDLFDVSRVFACFLIGFLFATSLAIEIMRLNHSAFGGWFHRFFGSMMREKESSQMTGATYVLAGSVLCSLISLYSESAAAAAFMGLTLFILGDAVAALVGKAVGRIKVGSKTVEGALGCYFLCVALAAFLFPRLPAFLADWGGQLSLFQILGISAAVSLLEFFPIKIGKVVLNDNLYVPAFVSLLALMMR